MMTARVITTILRLRMPRHAYIVMTLAVIMRGRSSWGGAPSSCSPLTPIPLISSHDLLLIALRHISLSGGLTLVSMPQEREERRGHHRRNQCHNHQHGKEGWRENSQVQTNVKHD